MWAIKPGMSGPVPVKTYVNPGAPVYILNGAGGNREGVDRRHDLNSNYSVNYISQWGVLIFTSHNSTAMDIDYYGSDSRELLDHVTLIVDHSSV